MKRKILLLAMLVLTAATLPAQTLTTLINVPGDEGGPIGGLTLAGNLLYGTTENGGGTVFSINTNGTGFTMLADLTGDVTYPRGNLVLANGSLYGISLGGGGSYGTVFSINTSGNSLAVLHSFTNSPDGAYPYGSLAISGNTLYGTTYSGGIDGYGTVFSINTNGSDYTVLHNFTNNPDGAYPVASVVVSGDTLYGTTWYGGDIDYNRGMVFSMNTDGSDFTVLYYFTNDSDGGNPLAGLTLSSNTLYGTTSQDGDDGYGTVFSLNTDGSNFKAIYSFSITNANTGNNQAGTEGNLLLSGSTLYGAGFAFGGGTYGSGFIYSLYTDGSAFSVLHRFTFDDADNHRSNSDGAIPWANTLVVAGDTLYGTTHNGGDADGTNGYGTVFALQFPGPQPDIKNIVFNTNNSVTISSFGGVGFTYLMQATTNLAPTIVWQNVSTNIADGNGLWQFTDALTNGGVFGNWQTNLIYAGSNGLPGIGPNTNAVIGTNVTFNSTLMRFYRAATAP